mmetsp:Transcript_45898/g.127369  ORF Transcript_45898/g.127369 Transcript_45898/m.127369 type:complete len:210 (+) Transcript_45898:396-1025(+)
MCLRAPNRSALRLPDSRRDGPQKSPRRRARNNVGVAFGQDVLVPRTVFGRWRRCHSRRMHFRARATRGLPVSSHRRRPASASFRSLLRQPLDARIRKSTDPLPRVTTFVAPNERPSLQGRHVEADVALAPQDVSVLILPNAGGAGFRWRLSIAGPRHDCGAPREQVAIRIQLHAVQLNVPPIHGLPVSLKSSGDGQPSVRRGCVERAGA